MKRILNVQVLMRNNGNFGFIRQMYGNWRKMVMPSKNDKKYKAWMFSTVILIVVILAFFAGCTIYIDPFFHYHAPLTKYEYPLNNALHFSDGINERYQNDGIVKHFEYDSIITGSSMTENFSASEADQIFNAHFIKVPFSGGYFKEVDNIIQRAFESNNNIKYVVRCLDYSSLVLQKDTSRDINYPEYLYNKSIMDDVNYLLNREVLFGYIANIIRYTNSGNKTTDFDEYTNWNNYHTFGKEEVLKSYELGEKSDTERELTEEERCIIYDNIRQNVIETANKHPETTFIYFFPPYSICYWDDLNNKGMISWHINAERAAIEEILQCENIKLFSFTNNFELITNLDNYKDRAHYGEWINSWMLNQFDEDNYLLTIDNYEEYLAALEDFYKTYDYSSIRE